MDKKIYILLTNTGSALSRCIGIYTKDRFTHVSIAFDRELNELYSFGRLTPNNPFIGGFIKEDILFGTYKRFPKTSCALYSLDISLENYQMLRKELNYFKENSEVYTYNLMGLFGVMLNKPLDRENSYFCSQFVSTILKNSNIDIINKPSGLVAPSDFLNCVDLDLIYEGNLLHYKRQLNKEIIEERIEDRLEELVLERNFLVKG